MSPFRSAAARLLSAALFAAFGTVAAADTLKIATVAPDGTAWMREMRAGADAVKQRTEGRVELKYYPGGVMGDPDTVLRKIKIGQLQGGAFTGGEISGVAPDAQLYSLPFLFRDQAEVDAVRAKLDDRVRANFEAGGFVALGLSGGRNLMAKTLYAQYYARLVFDQELHDRLLHEVLAAPTDAPRLTLINTLAQQRAQALLDSGKDYF